MNEFHQALPDSGGSNPHLLTSCPMCQTAYQPLTTRVIAERNEDHLLYFECRHCGSAMVAMVTAEAAGLSSASAITDLTSGEILTTSAEAPILADEVIDLYAYLQKQPSLYQILRREKAIL